MKRRGFLGTLFGLPAAAVALKVRAAPEKVVEKAVEPVIEASSAWKPEDDYWCATAVPLTRPVGDFIYRRMVK